MASKESGGDAGAPQVIIIDMGSGTTKAGFSGEDAPRSVVQTVVGTQAIRGDEVVAEGGETVPDFVVGDSALAQRETLSLAYPVEKGLCQDWEAMEKLLKWTFEQELGINPENDGLPVLVTDAPHNPQKDRGNMTKTLFETFKVKGCYIATQAVLSLFASGRTTGMVVESGEGLTCAVPVFEGYTLRHGVRRFDVSGAALTKQLMASLAKSFKLSKKHSQLVRTIKEKYCQVAIDYDAACKKGGLDKEYELPDGEVIPVSYQSCIQCGEALFQPSKILGTERSPSAHAGYGASAYNGQGVSALTSSSIKLCDPDLQRLLAAHIIPAGGTSMLPQFADRLKKEVSAALPTLTVDVLPDSQRKYAAWIGGSMLGSLPTWGHIEITKQEYDDNHESIVHRKCF